MGVLRVFNMPTATARRFLVAFMLVFVASSVGGCAKTTPAGPDEGQTPAPGFAALLAGNVFVDNQPTEGVAIALLTVGGELLATTQTDANGSYVFSVNVGLHVVQIGQPYPDIEWDLGIQQVDIQENGQGLVERDFNGMRRLTGFLQGVMLVIGGNLGHNLFVFNADNDAHELRMERVMNAYNRIRIGGPSLSPTTLPELEGSFDESTGAVDISGTATIAGFAGIDVEIDGTITGALGELKTGSLELRLGYAGGLPGGQGITYGFSGSLEDALEQTP